MMYFENVLDIHPCEMMVIGFYTFMKKITIYVLVPELDGLSHTRRKLTEWIPAVSEPPENVYTRLSAKMSGFGDSQAVPKCRLNL